MKVNGTPSHIACWPAAFERDVIEVAIEERDFLKFYHKTEFLQNKK